ncbi:MAG TPA: type II CAAX endopeptidase family protein [Nitrospiraceae bacterium]|nr:type II CAAX endopeptidase family protein [Nitrospiraceae bacterium]
MSQPIPSAAVPPPICIGAPPPPRPYDPRFSKVVTSLSAILLGLSIVLVGWFAVDIPKLDRIAEPERALGHMVSRLMDVEDGFAGLPAGERLLYDITMGGDADERDQAIVWYRELAEVSTDPTVAFNLVVLLAESGRVADARAEVAQWKDRDEPYPLLGEILEAAYGGARLSRAQEQRTQADLADLIPAGWFYDRVATRIAEAAGDTPLLQAVRESADRRVQAVMLRSRIFAAVEALLMLTGIIVFLLWYRRRDEGFWRVSQAESPPLWAGSLGAAVLLRGGAIGALLTLGFMFAAFDYSSLRLLVVPLSNVPLLFLAYIHLLKPQGLGFGDGFGLRVDRGKAGRLLMAVVAVVAAGLFGEWVMGKIADPLNLSSHWTEWFDADLVWGPLPVMVVSLIEYVVLAPVFEELAFRGLLFGVLRRRFEWMPAACISAGIFALAHGYGLIGFLSVFWSGLIWAWIYERTGSLLPGIIAHAVNNLLVCFSVIALLRS